MALTKLTANGGDEEMEEMAGHFIHTQPEQQDQSDETGRSGADAHPRTAGRTDMPLKIGGHLVEPADVEKVLLSSGEVAEVVMVTDSAAGEVRLIAYVVPARGTRPSRASFRRVLRDKLPSSMLPVVVTVPALPRATGGEVDRLALPPAPAGGGFGEDRPRDQWEETVAALWARVLGLDEVGIHDDFTELGGDSLAAEELLGRVAEELGLQLPTSIIADAPTVAQFAVRARNAAAGTVRHPSVVPLQLGGARTPLFCFAGAGGLAIGLLTLARHFGRQRPVYGLQAHGLECRGIPDWTVRAAARRHAQHLRLLCPRGPYILLGHSLGGLVAYEAAQMLRASGENVALLVAIDTFLPGSLRVSRSGTVSPSLRANVPQSRPVAGGGLARHQLLAGRLRQLAQLPFAGIVQYQGMNQYDVFYNLGKVMTLSHRVEPYAGRTLVLLAEGRRDASSWQGVLTGPHTIRKVERGDHDNLLREPLVSRLATELKAQLDELGI